MPYRPYAREDSRMPHGKRESMWSPGWEVKTINRGTEMWDSFVWPYYDNLHKQTYKAHMCRFSEYIFAVVKYKISPPDNYAKLKGKMSALQSGLNMFSETAPRIGDSASQLEAWGKSFVQFGSAIFRFANQVSKRNQ